MGVFKNLVTEYMEVHNINVEVFNCTSMQFINGTDHKHDIYYSIVCCWCHRFNKMIFDGRQCSSCEYNPDLKGGGTNE